jgi:hypothetical protein
MLETTNLLKNPQKLKKIFKLGKKSRVFIFWCDIIIGGGRYGY